MLDIGPDNTGPRSGMSPVMGMYMKGLCENVKGAWDWLFHEHISRRIMAVFVIFFLISFFLTYSLYSWAARKQEDSMIEQSSVQMVTGVRNQSG